MDDSSWWSDWLKLVGLVWVWQQQAAGLCLSLEPRCLLQWYAQDDGNDSSIFLHAIAQKLPNAWRWNISGMPVQCGMTIMPVHFCVKNLIANEMKNIF